MLWLNTSQYKHAATHGLHRMHPVCVTVLRKEFAKKIEKKRIEFACNSQLSRNLQWVKHTECAEALLVLMGASQGREEEGGHQNPVDQRGD